MCRNFVWSGKHDQKNMAPIAWDQLCCPEEEGGLGILQVRTWNKAACAKLLWKVAANVKCLWTQWVKAAYLHDESIWEVAPKNDQPWVWKKILKLRSLVRPHVSCQVGDGRQTSLFYDKWLLLKPLCEYMLNDVKNWGRNLKVSSWWNLEAGWTIPNSFKRRYPMLAENIQRKQLSDNEDRFIWQPKNSDLFSVESFYELLRCKKPKVNWYRLIWNCRIPPKVSFICWLLMHKRLKTRHFLTARGVHISTECVFCNFTHETCEHLFFQCGYCKQVWKELLASIGICRNPQHGAQNCHG